MNDKIASDIDEWVRKCSKETYNFKFCLQVFRFLKFVSDVIHELPGPKGPARKYFEMRNKRKKNIAKQNIKYKISSNTTRKTKNGRRRRKEKYEYEIIQHEYYNRKNRAEGRIMGNESKGCKINFNALYKHFHQRFSFTKHNILAKYHNKIENLDINSEYSENIDKEEVDWVVKFIKIYTSPRPDMFVDESDKNQTSNTNLITHLFHHAFQKFNSQLS